MIKARDFRINNYVDLYKNDIHYCISVIKNIDNNGINKYLPSEYEGVFGNSINDELLIKPIPLTEEWLLKFGWGKGEYDTEYVDNVSLKQECLSYNVGAKMFCIETNGDIMEIKHIRYVHQLQNIFYCLTGQELELK